MEVEWLRCRWSGKVQRRQRNEDRYQAPDHPDVMMMMVLMVMGSVRQNGEMNVMLG